MMNRTALTGALALLAAAPVLRAQGVIRTVAGTDWFFPDDGRPALGAALGTPIGVALDAGGNVYFTDSGNSMVFRVDSSGNIHVVAGNGLRGSAGDEGPATSASFDGLSGIAADAQGNLYISENGSNRVRKVTPDGIIHAFARISGGLRMLDVDGSGNVYVAASASNLIHKIDPLGNVSVVAGNGSRGFSGDGGKATDAALASPRRAALGPDGSLYIADNGNNRIRRVTPNGMISTFAGNGQSGSSGVDGPASEAAIAGPFDIAVDSLGNVSFTSSFNVLLRVDTQGILRRIGNPASYDLTEGGLAGDPAGNLYFSEPFFRRVRKVASGVISTFAGGGAYRGAPSDAPAVETPLSQPQGVRALADGSVLIADTGARLVRKLAADGTLTTIAGNGNSGGTVSGAIATQTSVSSGKIAMDNSGNLYLSGGFIIYQLRPDGRIYPFAGAAPGGFGGDGGPATQALIGFRPGIAADAAGNLYIADAQNNRIRRVGPDGIITTIAGTGSANSSGDGGPAIDAGISQPNGITVSGGGNLYIAEGSGRIRQIDMGKGTVQTVAQPGFGRLTDIVRDADDNIYVTAPGAHRVIIVSPSGQLISTAGTGEQGFTGDGGSPAAARLNAPEGLTLDSKGRLYIADTLNDRVRAVDIVRPSFQLSLTTLPLSGRSGGLAVSQSFDVSSETTGLPFNVAVSTTGGGGWLAASPVSGVAPGRVRITANPSALAPGEYSGTVTVSAPLASPPSLTVTVRFIVTQPEPALLKAEPTGLTFTRTVGDGPAVQQLRISNSGSGAIAFTANVSTEGGPWLTVTPANGEVTPNSPLSLAITASPAGLLSGTYSGRIRIASPGFAEIVVPVTLTVNASPQRILLSQTGLTFIAVAGGGTPPAQRFFAAGRVSKRGRLLPFQAAAGADDTGPGFQCGGGMAGDDCGAHRGRLRTRRHHWNGGHFVR